MSVSRVLSFFLLILFSCQTGSRENRHSYFPNGSQGINTEIRYAEGFSVSEVNGIKKLSVFNPWQKAKDISFCYYLLKNNQALPPGLSENEIIRVPVQSIVCLSTTHIGFIEILGETNKITAVAGSRYISSAALRNRINAGLVKDIGYDQNLNYELLVSLKPGLVMVYGIGSETTGYLNKLRELGIKVIFNAEYLERTPLGKAEWIKFVGHLFQKEEKAEAIFESIENEYQSLTALAAVAENRPNVLINLPWRGNWHMAGGDSFFARMIKDAGGRYLWEENTDRESFPADIESVFQRARIADVWINTGTAATIEDILAEDQRLQRIKPILSGRVYNNNGKLSESGGNDYWEKGIVEPQVILKDLIHIFHPGLIPDHRLVYYTPVQ